MSEYIEAIRSHYARHWGPADNELALKRGSGSLPTGFRVLVFPPRPTRKMYTYATCGMSEFTSKSRIELHLFSPVSSELNVETLTVIADFHASGASLNVGHTVNIGRPWLDASKCDYGLLSLPYLDGSKLECCALSGGRGSVRCLWLIPITLRERNYATENGLDALEQRFQSSGFNYVNPKRSSVV